MHIEPQKDQRTIYGIMIVYMGVKKCLDLNLVHVNMLILMLCIMVKVHLDKVDFTTNVIV